MLVRDFGLHLEATNNDGCTPLVQAVLGGYTVTVISLINDLGARVDAVITNGSTALHQAASMGFTDTALALISIGRARIDAAAKDGDTPLHMACFYGHPTMVSALLAEGASLDAKLADGRTPQQLICLQPSADPANKPLVVAAIARYKRLAVLGKEMLKAAAWSAASTAAAPSCPQPPARRLATACGPRLGTP